MSRVIRFLSEVRAELTKVVWPNRREALKMTGIVVLFSIAVAVFLGVIDFGLQKLVEFLLEI